MDSNNDCKNVSVKRKRIIPVNVAQKEEELNQINVPQYIGSLQVVQNVSESNLCGVLNNTSLNEAFLSKESLHAKAKAEVDILSVFNGSRSDEWCPPSVEQAQKDLLQPGRRVQVNLSESCIVDYAKLSGKLSRNKDNSEQYCTKSEVWNKTSKGEGANSSTEINVNERFSVHDFKSWFDQVVAERQPHVFRGLVLNEGACPWPAISLWHGMGGVNRLDQLAGSAPIQIMVSDDGHFSGSYESHTPAASQLSTVLQALAEELLHRKSDTVRGMKEGGEKGRSLGNEEKLWKEQGKRDDRSKRGGKKRKHSEICLPEKKKSSLHLYLAQESLDTNLHLNHLKQDLLPKISSKISSKAGNSRGTSSELINSLDIMPLLQGRSLRATNLWIAASEVRSSLHLDQPDNLLVVVTGSKKLTLFGPGLTPFLDPFPVTSDSSNHSRLPLSFVNNGNSKCRSSKGCRKEARKKWLMSQAITVHLLPGDALFLPSGWWHQVDSTAATIAVNFWWDIGEEVKRDVEFNDDEKILSCKEEPGEDKMKQGKISHNKLNRECCLGSLIRNRSSVQIRNLSRQLAEQVSEVWIQNVDPFDMRGVLNFAASLCCTQSQLRAAFEKAAFSMLALASGAQEESTTSLGVNYDRNDSKNLKQSLPPKAKDSIQNKHSAPILASELWPLMSLPELVIVIALCFISRQNRSRVLERVGYGEGVTDSEVLRKMERIEDEVKQISGRMRAREKREKGKRERGGSGRGRKKERQINAEKTSNEQIFTNDGGNNLKDIDIIVLDKTVMEVNRVYNNQCFNATSNGFVHLIDESARQKLGLTHCPLVALLRSVYRVTSDAHVVSRLNHSGHDELQMKSSATFLNPNLYSSSLISLSMKSLSNALYVIGRLDPKIIPWLFFDTFPIFEAEKNGKMSTPQQIEYPSLPPAAAYLMAEFFDEVTNHNATAEVESSSEKRNENIYSAKNENMVSQDRDNNDSLSPNTLYGDANTFIGTFYEIIDSFGNSSSLNISNDSNTIIKNSTTDENTIPSIRFFKALLRGKESITSEALQRVVVEKLLNF